MVRLMPASTVETSSVDTIRGVVGRGGLSPPQTGQAGAVLAGLAIAGSRQLGQIHGPAQRVQQQQHTASDVNPIFSPAHHETLDDSNQRTLI